MAVIATRHAGIPTQVIEGKTGLLIAENDVVAMQNAMTRLAFSSELSKSFGSVGAQLMKRSWHKNVQLEAFREVLIACIRN